MVLKSSSPATPDVYDETSQSFNWLTSYEPKLRDALASVCNTHTVLIAHRTYPRPIFKDAYSELSYGDLDCFLGAQIDPLGWKTVIEMHISPCSGQLVICILGDDTGGASDFYRLFLNSIRERLGDEAEDAAVRDNLNRYLKRINLDGLRTGVEQGCLTCSQGDWVSLFENCKQRLSPLETSNPRFLAAYKDIQHRIKPF